MFLRKPHAYPFHFIVVRNFRFQTTLISGDHSRRTLHSELRFYFPYFINSLYTSYYYAITYLKLFYRIPKQWYQNYYSASPLPLSFAAIISLIRGDSTPSFPSACQCFQFLLMTHLPLEVSITPQFGQPSSSNFPIHLRYVSNATVFR